MIESGSLQTPAPINSTSRPVRLIPQTAQPIEFSCPLCGTIHAAYFFSSTRFKVYRCGGCGLTFANPLPQASPVDDNAAANRPKRTEEQHKALLAQLPDDIRSGPVLLVADPDDSIVALLQQMNVDVHLTGKDGDPGAISSTKRFNAVIISDALMRVDDPCRTLRNARSLVAVGAPILFSLPLLDGDQAKLMGRNWHEWQAANRWYFTREILHLMLLATGFEKVWFEAERRSYSLDVLADRLMQRDELSVWQRGVMAAHRVFPQMMRGWKLPLPSGTTVVTAVAAAARADCTVSIIVPVYNEGATVRELLDCAAGVAADRRQQRGDHRREQLHRRQPGDRRSPMPGARASRSFFSPARAARDLPSARGWRPPPATSC